MQIVGDLPRQKLEKVVKIQFWADFHDFFVGLDFREFHFETAPSTIFGLIERFFSLIATGVATHRIHPGKEHIEQLRRRCFFVITILSV